MKRIFKNKKGVTLAELLAVVTIMGIIAAIAVPMVGNTIDNARKDAFLGDAIAIQSAVRTYCLTATAGTVCDTGGVIELELATYTADSTEEAVAGLLSKSFADTDGVVDNDATAHLDGAGGILVSLDNQLYSFGTNAIPLDPTGAGIDRDDVS